MVSYNIYFISVLCNVLQTKFSYLDDKNMLQKIKENMIKGRLYIVRNLTLMMEIKRRLIKWLHVLMKIETSTKQKEKTATIRLLASQYLLVSFLV